MKRKKFYHPITGNPLKHGAIGYRYICGRLGLPLLQLRKEEGK
jgi:hypothetical protein